MRVFAAAALAIRTGRPAALATVISVGGSAPRSAGARMLIFADGESVGTIGGGAVEYKVVEAAVSVMSTGRPIRFVAHLTRDLGMCCGGEMEVYIEPLQIRHPLVIFGAGHVAMATAPSLCALDFSVTIVDERPEYARSERFPGCEVMCLDPRSVAEKMEGGVGDHWLVVTHDHQLDQDLVATLLPKKCAWLGMIGSRAKVAKFLMRYRAAGMDETLFSKLCAPVGLDIGAETPQEIAVAIAAELIRVRRGITRLPQPLSEIPLPARGGDGIACPPGRVQEE